MAAPFLSQVNLGLQVVILVLLFSSYLLKRGGKFFVHGRLMLTAVILNLVGFLLVMGPSLVSLTADLFAGLSLVASLIVLIHAALGSIVLILGIWIVGSWRLRSNVQPCVRKKHVMRITIVLWIITLLLGVYVYALLYF
jgi:uncharacterized membrane protein YozB (DUF420 family)